MDTLKVAVASASFKLYWMCLGAYRTPRLLLQVIACIPHNGFRLNGVMIRKY